MAGHLNESQLANEQSEVIKEEKVSAVEKRQSKQKVALIEQLRKTPIVQIACEKTGISRATFYRWKNDDKEFSETIEVALHEGSELVNDMAESQLMAAIRDQNLGAITFWLRNNHPKYSNKVEINASIRQEAIELTEEEKTLIEKALRLTALQYDKGEHTTLDGETQ